MRLSSCIGDRGEGQGINWKGKGNKNDILDVYTYEGMACFDRLGSWMVRGD